MARKVPLKNIEDYIHILHNTAKVVILLLDEKANILYVNKYIETLTGYDREDIIGKNWIEIFIPSMYNKKIDNVFKDIIEKKNMHWGTENEIVCKDNSIKTLSWNNSLCLDADGNFEAILSIGHDITVLKETELELESKIATLNHEKEKQQFLLNNLKNIVIEIENEELVNANESLLDFFGCKSFAEFKEEIKCICYRFVEHPDFFHLGLVERGKMWIEALYKLPKAKQMVIMIDKNNDLHAFSVKLTRILDSRSYIISFDDITAMMEKSKEFEYKAYHDTLTRIFNRAKFTEVLATLENTPQENALLLLDIDKFKNINDTYGHQVGDKVLQKLSATIKQLIRPTDVFARWGGEEFVLLLRDSDAIKAFEKAELLRQHIASLKSEQIPSFTVSIGVTMIKPYEPQSFYIKRADEALYESKATGRNKTTLL